MKKRLPFYFVCFFLLSFLVYAEKEDFLIKDRMEALFRDLEIVEGLEKKSTERFPVFFSHYNHVGYINMPSSRTAPGGTVFIGSSSVPPYYNHSIGFQIFDRIEISGNYRVFKGIEDVNLSSKGFGDYSDKGADVKCVLLHPEESSYRLPGIAVGVEDFIGSKLFQAQYLTMTQVFPELDLEATIGYGNRRFNGFFGGLLWTPFRRSPYSYLQGLAFVGEYDATDYENAKVEPHPDARFTDSSLNFGVKYRLWNSIDMSVSRVRGRETAASVNLHTNIGSARGFLPKLDASLPYGSPKNTEQLGYKRSETVLVQEFIHAFKEHGFDLRDAYLNTDVEAKVLRITLSNKEYVYEYDLREQLHAILCRLTPEDVTFVDVRIEYEGLACHEYRFRNEDLKRRVNNEIGDFELSVISPKREIASTKGMTSLYHKKKKWIDFKIRPRWQNYFGSAAGKFKYELGITGILDGYLSDTIYYSCQGTCSIASSVSDVGDRDALNPSLLINVRSDSVKYRQSGKFIVEHVYLQKNWNMGKGFFSRLAAGHFEAAFGGGVSEFLYFPAENHWAIGFEGAVLKKREFDGLRFQNQVRQLIALNNGSYPPTYHHFTAYQLLADVYMDLPLEVEARFRFGQFLAHDKGVKMEFSRTFASGITLQTWYTITDAVDRVNGERYYDYGVGFSMPIDLSYSYNTRDRWGYKIAPWLRDVGGVASTGRALYSGIKNERKN